MECLPEIGLKRLVSIAQKWAIAMIGLTMLYFEGICTLGLGIRKAIEYCQCCLMEQTSGGMEILVLSMI